MAIGSAGISVSTQELEVGTKVILDGAEFEVVEIRQKRYSTVIMFADEWCLPATSEISGDTIYDLIWELA